MSEAMVSTQGVVRESANEPGSVIIDTLRIRTFSGREIDVSNFCVELSLHEDIFSNVMYGEALFVDAANLITTIPIQGTEYLTFAYRTPTFKQAITRSMMITGISNRQMTNNDSEQLYVVKFMSPEGVMDEQWRISRKYKGASNVVVQDIFTEYLNLNRVVGKNSSSELRGAEVKTASTSEFVAPYWSPLKCINWVAGHTQASRGSAPNYLFFESNKAFYFTSIEALIVQQRNAGVVFSDYYYSMTANSAIRDRKSNFKYSVPDIDMKYQMVERMGPLNQFDSLRSWEHGHYASTLITHDIVRKQYREFVYDHPTESKRFNAAEDYVVAGTTTQSAPEKNTGIIPPDKIRSANNKRTLYAVHSEMFPGFKLAPELTAQARNSLLHDLSQIRLELEVPGRTDIEVGRLIQFFYPKAIEKMESTNTAEAFDPFLSGLYLITAIRHVFSLGSHKMYLEVVKDSYPTAPTQ
jgi:hypothetical protein